MIMRPGSHGEHALQKKYGSEERANNFYQRQTLDHLNPSMQEFIGRQEMVFIATADARGNCDCSFRAGPPGFMRVLDRTTILYPEYRGNGVFASLGNITENPHIGLIFVDFFEATIGLHVNAKAQIVDKEVLQRLDLPLEVRQDMAVEGRRSAERWVFVEVEEAYIHCSKQIPLLDKLDKEISRAKRSQAKLVSFRSPPGGDSALEITSAKACMNTRGRSSLEIV
jgi:predicted pyridoxine 5'-phosphate oxidase superfamily flavin-nucleotide-binding protein